MLQPEYKGGSNDANEAEIWTQRLNQDLDDDINLYKKNRSNLRSPEPATSQPSNVDEIDPSKYSGEMLPRL